MKNNHLPATCNTCDHSWEHPVDLPMDMGDFIKAVKKIRCPRCQSRGISMNFGDGAELSRSRRDYRHG